MIHNKNTERRNREVAITRKAAAATKLYADGVGTELPDALKVTFNFATMGIGLDLEQAERTARQAGPLGRVFLEYYRKAEENYND